MRERKKARKLARRGAIGAQAAGETNHLTGADGFHVALEREKRREEKRDEKRGNKGPV